MKIGIIQQSCTSDIAKNKEKLKKNIEKAVEGGAQLVVLQELHNSLYFCQTENVEICNLAEPIPGESTEFYSAIAKKHGIYVTSSDIFMPHHNNNDYYFNIKDDEWFNVKDNIFIDCNWTNKVPLQ